MRWMTRIGLLIVGLLPGLGFAADLIDLNTADVVTLEELPGIGPSKASAIIEHREAYGPFDSLDDLGEVPGLGDATLRILRPLVTIEGQSDGQSDGQEEMDAPPPPSVADPVPNPQPPSGVPTPTLTAESGLLDRININIVDAQGLEELPGIGPAKAEAIIQYRERNGPFAGCDGLIGVPGIGPATVSAVQESCTTR